MVAKLKGSGGVNGVTPPIVQCFQRLRQNRLLTGICFLPLQKGVLFNVFNGLAIWGVELRG